MPSCWALASLFGTASSLSLAVFGTASRHPGTVRLQPAALSSRPRHSLLTSQSRERGSRVPSASQMPLTFSLTLTCIYLPLTDHGNTSQFPLLLHLPALHPTQLRTDRPTRAWWGQTEPASALASPGTSTSSGQRVVPPAAFLRRPSGKTMLPLSLLHTLPVSDLREPERKTDQRKKSRSSS